MTKWYEKGARFTCQGCGGCCSGFPGYVWLSMAEIEKMAAFLHMSVEEFAKKYTRRVGDYISLIETAPNYDCIFFREKKCLIYPARPVQCCTYPFWEENMESKKTYEALSCPGICAENATLRTLEEIEKNLKRMEEREF